MNKTLRYRIFERLAQAIPSPTTELVYSTPFELLVAVVLSAQATDKGVNKATARLFAVAHTPEAILALGEEGLRDYLKTINLYNSKTRHLLGLCQRLIEQHGSQVPDTRAELEALLAAGGGAQNRQRHPQHGVRPTRHCRGYPHLPGRQPHPAGTG